MNRAAVAIPEKLFFKIGEVCDLTGVQAHVLRYWESEFPMLAPQKNRAGQRTYRKRDVEMALRIKELLYEDQYTIAGAKKKLASELRGASKLKVVPTPEPGAQPAASQPPLQSAAPAPSVESQPVYESSAGPDTRYAISDDQRVAVRRLAEQLRDLLHTLDAGEADLDARRK
ncbi:MAG TPA: MerR family transcriptional regulator [Pyrinomonadaceae bacterium]|nr:MerR family transcriptional regulator [Pyrinomonadaceae bacterium]